MLGWWQAYFAPAAWPQLWMQVGVFAFIFLLGGGLSLEDFFRGPHRDPGTVILGGGIAAMSVPARQQCASGRDRTEDFAQEARGQARRARGTGGICTPLRGRACRDQ
ncbi:hypothetical protein DRW03_01710 [Corallococcus sp. H22C18031201]|nr:hypothetical protein DRW03_01710 [Corallococcus sp. H22C18031201]